MFGTQRKKQEGQQRHQYEVAYKYVFKCRSKVDSDDDDVTNDGRLFHARAFNRAPAFIGDPASIRTLASSPLRLGPY